MRKIGQSILLGLVLVLLALVAILASKSSRSIPPTIEVYFSPQGGCTEAVVRRLDQATNSIRVQAYSFTSAPIAQALVKAHRRGVQVQVLLDHSQETEKYSEADFLKNSGVPTLIDARHAIAHNKIILIDESIVITGSFNFTRAAEEKNAENLLVIYDPALAGKYLQNWRVHAQHSEPYQRNTPAQTSLPSWPLRASTPMARTGLSGI